MENADPNIPRVQHVAKASSDQLLRKFAEVDCHSDKKIPARLPKRPKTNQECGEGARKSLLPAVAPRKQAALMRRMGLSRAKIKAREIKNKSIITAIEKVGNPNLEQTWRKTVEGASRVLMEKHYNRHKRLISYSH